MKLTDQIFLKALVENSVVPIFEKNSFIKQLKEVTGIKELTENEETLLSFFIQEYNEKSIVGLSLLNLIEKLKSTKSNSAALSLLSKIESNSDIKAQIDEYNELRKKSNRKWIIGFIIFLIVAILFVCWKYNYIKLPGVSKSGGNVLVIDVDLLAQSATSHVINSALSPEQSQQFANQYRDSLQKEVESYLDKGYVILNRINVYAYSRDQDITYEILDRMGIKPVDDSELKTKYSGSQRYDVLRNYAIANIDDVAREALDEKQAVFNQQAEQQLDKAQIMTNENGQSIDVE